MAEQQYYLPAEWEPHEATWIGWPANRSDWPGKMVPVQWAYVEIVRHLATSEIVRILVQDAALESRARGMLIRAGVDPRQVEFVRMRTDRVWCRDCGPIFVRAGGRTGALTIADFAFTGWAKYDNHKLDDKVSAHVAGLLGKPLWSPVFDGRRLELEGGAIDVNGKGSLLTTEECLLDHTQQPRNAHMDKPALNAALHTALGARNVIYLGKGIAGDDTGGHIDDLARFTGPRTIVLARETNPKDANYQPLAEANERLQTARLEDGSIPAVAHLPCPQPLVFGGVRLPASYANFYIANQVVLVPTFNDPADRIALGTLQELFPTRKVVGIHAVDLVWGFGTLHCLTQQQPAD